jgi:hypothetical protein
MRNVLVHLSTAGWDIERASPSLSIRDYIDFQNAVHETARQLYGRSGQARNVREPTIKLIVVLVIAAVLSPSHYPATITAQL